MVLLTMMVVIPAPGGAVVLKHVMSVYADNQEVGFSQPTGIGCADPTRFAVADSGNKRVVVFEFKDSALSVLRTLKLNEAPNPVKVAFTTGGGLVVLDGKTHRLARVNSEGKFADYIRPSGMPDQRTVIPKNFCLDQEGKIYLLDVFGGRVLVLGPNGKFLRQIDFPEKVNFISDLAITPKGDLVAVDSVASAVYKATSADSELKPLNIDLSEAQVRFPVALSVDDRSFIYLIDRHSGSVAVLGPDGSLQGHKLTEGWNEGALWFPAGICVNDSGWMFIADTENNRVQVFEIAR